MLNIISQRRGFIALICRQLAVVFLVIGLWGCSGASGPLAEMLGPLTPPSPGQVARDAFNVHDPDLRRRSISTLSASSFGGEPPYVRLYRLLADDSDPTVRAACVRAIGMHGELDDMGLFVRCLKDEDAVVRWESARALQKFHGDQAVGPLIDAVGTDEDADVRMAATDALGQYPQMRSYQALVGALDDGSFGVVEAARRSLSTLTGYDFGNEGSLWLMWAQRHNGHVFDEQKPYTWQPYIKPPSLLDKAVDKAMFWTKPVPVEPKVPKGLEAEADAKIDTDADAS